MSQLKVRTSRVISTMAVPSYRRLALYITTFSFLSGFLMRLRMAPPADALLFGGAEGIFLLAVPAFLTAVLASSAQSRKGQRIRPKYFAGVAFASVVLVALSYFAVLAFFGLSTTSYLLVVLVNAVAFILWLVALSVLLGMPSQRAIPVALAYPLFNLAFLVLWRKMGIIEASMAGVPSAWILVPKLLVASFVMLLSLWAGYYLLNAPAKRNFGVSAIQAASLFFTQTINGGKGLESVLDDMGEDAVTTVGAVAFKSKKTGRLKALFASPNVHFGPFGNLGGSEFPPLLSAMLGKELGCEVLVFHGTAYHDFNPVSSESVNSLAKVLSSCARTGERFSPRGALLVSETEDARVAGFSFGKDAFLSISPSPFPAGDVDFASGQALALAAEKKFGTAVVCDGHNADGFRRPWSVGSREFFEFKNAVEKLRPTAGKPFKLGVASSPLDGFSHRDGVGKAGLKVAVLEFGDGRKACIALFDANNVEPSFREKALEVLAVYGFDFYDVFTTDTHAVNDFSSVYNPLGGRGDVKRLLAELDKAAERAVYDAEYCEARVSTSLYAVRVLGTGKAGELITTMNSIVAVAKIIAPVVFVVSVALALVALAWV